MNRTVDHILLDSVQLRGIYRPPTNMMLS